MNIESLRILAERLSQSEIGLPLRQICYYSPPEEVGVFSTEIKFQPGGSSSFARLEFYFPPDIIWLWSVFFFPITHAYISSI